MGEYAVEISGLKKSFSDKEGFTWALKGIDLKIKKNQIFGLLGPNGAGKTTLIYILSNLILPTSGSAKVLGYDVVNDGDEIRKRSGICLGGTFFYWDMNPREILEYYGRLYGIERGRRRRNIDNLINELGIKKFEKKTFSHLSTGMRQRVAVAKSIVNDPEILFLDEPTAGLDVEVSIDVRNFIMDLIKEREMTVILTSHHLSEVEQMCKRTAIINKGGLVVEGDIRQIKSDVKIPDVIRLYLSDYSKLDFVKSIPGVINFGVSDGLFISVDSGLKRIESIINEFKKKKINITDLEIKKATLEEVFLSIVGRSGNIITRHGEGR
jgi:ABC-2 type transport system ATP-binding protein